MGWYLTLPGLFAAMTGGLILLARRWSAARAIFFLTALSYSLFYFYSQRCTPTHIWMMRRFSTVVFPVLLVLDRLPEAYFYAPLKFLYGINAYTRYRTDHPVHWKNAVKQWRSDGRGLITPVLFWTVIPAAAGIQRNSELEFAK